MRVPSFTSIIRAKKSTPTVGSESYKRKTNNKGQQTNWVQTKIIQCGKNNLLVLAQQFYYWISNLECLKFFRLHGRLIKKSCVRWGSKTYNLESAAAARYFDVYFLNGCSRNAQHSTHNREITSEHGRESHICSLSLALSSHTLFLSVSFDGAVEIMQLILEYSNSSSSSCMCLSSTADISFDDMSHSKHSYIIVHNVNGSNHSIRNFGPRTNKQRLMQDDAYCVVLVGPIWMWRQYDASSIINVVINLCLNLYRFHFFFVFVEQRNISSWMISSSARTPSKHRLICVEHTSGTHYFIISGSLMKTKMKKNRRAKHLRVHNTFDVDRVNLILFSNRIFEFDVLKKTNKGPTSLVKR